MKVIIEYNNKKIDVELTAEQMKELGLQEEKKTGWERADFNKIYGADSAKAYAYINSCVQLTQEMDYDTMADNMKYQQGNYFTDKNLAVKMCKRVRLMLKMQRWADEHNWLLDWNDGNKKYYIYYDTEEKKIYCDYNTITIKPGVVYFSSPEIACAAIREFGDEMIDCYAESEVTKS